MGEGADRSKSITAAAQYLTKRAQRGPVKPVPARAVTAGTAGTFDREMNPLAAGVEMTTGWDLGVGGTSTLAAGTGEAALSQRAASGGPGGSGGPMAAAALGLPVWLGQW